MEKVGMPTFSGIKESMISYALGVGGGILYGLSSAIFGSGLIGGLLGAGIAGAAIKGVRGEIISTVLGFQTVVGAMSSGNASQDTSYMV
jgi:hypothetical protein